MESVNVGGKARGELELEKLVEEISRSRYERFLAAENTLKAMKEAKKLEAEAAKLEAEKRKVEKELKWYEVVIIVSITVSATLAVTGVVKVFL